MAVPQLAKVPSIGSENRSSISAFQDEILNAVRDRTEIKYFSINMQHNMES